jgi:hypothetical protein
MADVELTLDQLRRLGTDTNAVADRIKAIFATLAQSRPAGQPWGSDTYGRQFAEDQDGKPGFTTSSQNLDQGGGNVSATLASYATGIRQAVTNAERSEQSSADQFTRR